MKNILDYLEWRGDLCFSQDKFNDIDALFFSLLSYLSFKDIVPGIDSTHSISLKEAADQYFAKYAVKDKKVSNLNMTASTSMDNELLKVLKTGALSRRFADVQLSQYEEKINFEAGEQFAAITFTLPVISRPKVIAFRGTDNTLVGWKEDFELAYMEKIPAQESACRYLNRSIGILSGRVTVCGHSKGGNLAMYAASCLGWLDRARVSRIINFDGPGFNFSVLPRSLFSACEKKIVSYLPEDSVVGMLLDPVGQRKVITSSAWSIYQHNPVNWEIQRTEFTPGQLTDSAMLLDNTLKTWLPDVAMERRKTAINALFDILGASEGKTIDPKEGLKDINKIIKNYANLDEDTKKVLTELLQSITRQARDTISETLKEKLSIVKRPRHENS